MYELLFDITRFFSIGYIGEVCFELLFDITRFFSIGYIGEVCSNCCLI